MTAIAGAATVERTDGLATITLARPSASNALDVALKNALLAAVRSVAADTSVRAVLLRAEGRNFCVGQDLAEHSAGLDADPATAMSTVGEHYNPIVRALAGLEVPVVVGISGACVGAGLGLALTADIRIAGQGAKFAAAFTGIGLASDSGLSHTLVAAVGASRASGLMLLGDRIGADRALEWGIVHRVVPDEEVDGAAAEIARGLAAGPTTAFRAVKDLLRHPEPTLDATLERERAAQERLGASADHRAAVTAFLAKTKPAFTGQ
ncbi:enoyl-CoA hydratase/isomerase family protein [Nocardia alni]|uniref:enoyl-CoA hydratase/isomerase family protein n=1 Tax=Nocardia alni TaxID=2815723 RepID=UPI001C24E547|nr:enoyl-CoA hydratase-related protein [Nocardia alni]